MQLYFAKASIGTGFEPVFNWFKSTVLATQLQLPQNIMDSNPVPIETFAKYGRIDHLWVINPLKNQ